MYPGGKDSSDDDTQIRHRQHHEVRVYGGTAGRIPEPTDDDDGHDVAEHTQEHCKEKKDCSRPDYLFCQRQGKYVHAG